MNRIFRAEDGTGVSEELLLDLIRHANDHRGAPCSYAADLSAILDKPKECGKMLHHSDWEPVDRLIGGRGWQPITCRLPADHDGPHVPDVPEEAWREVREAGDLLLLSEPGGSPELLARAVDDA